MRQTISISEINEFNSKVMTCAERIALNPGKSFWREAKRRQAYQDLAERNNEIYSALPDVLDPSEALVSLYILKYRKELKEFEALINKGLVQEAFDLLSPYVHLVPKFFLDQDRFLLGVAKDSIDLMILQWSYSKEDDKRDFGSIFGCYTLDIENDERFVLRRGRWYVSEETDRAGRGYSVLNFYIRMIGGGVSDYLAKKIS